MKKFLFTVITLILLVLSLTACNKKTGDAQDNEKPKVEISEDGYVVVNGEKTEHNIYTEPVVSATPGVVYDISADGTYAEVVAYSGTAVEVKIASEYNGLPVKNIYSEAFENNSTITYVIVPDSVTSIGKSAFQNCDSLSSVTIGNSVTSIGDDAFFGCDSLARVNIPDSVTSIGATAFYNCSRLTRVTIGNSVTSIGASAFSNCSRLSSVTIGNSVTSIGASAFYNCSSLTSVTFKNTEGWWVSSSSTATSGRSISAEDLANPKTAANYLRNTYYNYYWNR